jgi:hypothetical protein
MMSPYQRAAGLRGALFGSKTSSCTAKSDLLATFEKVIQFWDASKIFSCARCFTFLHPAMQLA